MSSIPGFASSEVMIGFTGRRLLEHLGACYGEEFASLCQERVKAEARDEGIAWVNDCSVLKAALTLRQERPGS